jgi:hypothetical protein
MDFEKPGFPRLGGRGEPAWQATRFTVCAPNQFVAFVNWIAPTERDSENALLGKRLWDAADQFRANSGLKSQEYSAPVLGLIFLRFAEVRFAAQRAKLEKACGSSRRGSRVDEPVAYHAEGILWLLLFENDTWS